MLKVLWHTEKEGNGEDVSVDDYWDGAALRTKRWLVDIPELLFFPREVCLVVMWYVRSIIISFYLSVLFTRRKLS